MTIYYSTKFHFNSINNLSVIGHGYSSLLPAPPPPSPRGRLALTVFARKSSTLMLLALRVHF